MQRGNKLVHAHDALRPGVDLINLPPCSWLIAKPFPRHLMAYVCRPARHNTAGKGSVTNNIYIPQLI